MVVVLRNQPYAAAKQKIRLGHRNAECINDIVYVATFSTYHYLCLLCEYVHVLGHMMSTCLHVSTV